MFSEPINVSLQNAVVEANCEERWGSGIESSPDLCLLIQKTQARSSVPFSDLPAQRLPRPEQK